VETQIVGTGRGRAFHITSDVPVAAYQTQPFGGGSAGVTAASLLLPTSVWDTGYIAVNAGAASNSGNPLLTLVAHEDGTEITLKP
ncbi:IgGFc-binding protein, partial [Streptococcus pneumoniae]|uniref:IgGFc-binding protein n=1 Tax=Streptococcus pneumoniae TaxID=1313 RepID=UPI0018B08584